MVSICLSYQLGNKFNKYYAFDHMKWSLLLVKEIFEYQNLILRFNPESQQDGCFGGKVSMPVFFMGCLVPALLATVFFTIFPICAM